MRLNEKRWLERIVSVITSLALVCTLSIGMVFAKEISATAETTKKNQFRYDSCSETSYSGVYLYGYVSADSNGVGLFKLTSHTLIKWRAKQTGSMSGASQSTYYSFGVGSSFDNITSKSRLNPFQGVTSVSYDEEKSYWFTSTKKGGVKIYY